MGRKEEKRTSVNNFWGYFSF